MSNLINKIFGGRPIGGTKPKQKNGQTSSEDNRISDIGKPFLVKHNVHVGFNPDTGKIEGLPVPWLDLLQEANIGTTEQLENPNAVINALKVYAYSMRKKPEKFLANQATIDNETEEIEHMMPMKGQKAGSESDTPLNSSTDNLMDDITYEMEKKKFFPKTTTDNTVDRTADQTRVKPQITVTKEETNGAGPQMRRKAKQEVKALSEEEIMAQLKSIVNNGNPKQRFKIIKKIGSGASGTVYTAVDNVTQDKVAIKTMDLAQQPKKELIITEIMVMKQNQ